MNTNVKTLIQEYSETIVSKDEGLGKGITVPEHQMELICHISRLLKMDVSNKDLQAIVNELRNMNRDPLEDDRAEIISVISIIEDYNFRRPCKTTQQLLKNAQSTALIVRKEDLSDYRNNPLSTSYKLVSKDLMERKVIVAGEKIPFVDNLPFGTQRSANALGSGFFFKKDGRYFVVTAAHVIFPPFLNLPLRDIRFVSNYMIRETSFRDQIPQKFDNIILLPKANVFKSIDEQLRPNLDYQLSSSGNDWAVIEIEPESEELDDFNNFSYLETKDLFGNPTYVEGGNYQAVYGLGHGFGLPLKLSACGEILNESLKAGNSSLYDCKMDFFSGNSGSAVFDSMTHQLIGMLIRGKKDIYFAEGRKDKVVPGVLSNIHSGEVCQNISFLKLYKPIDRTLKEIRELIPLHEFLPYTNLERGLVDGIYELNICMVSSKKEVQFATYPSKIGNITIIDCFIGEETTEGKNIYKEKYIIYGPKNKELANSDETIEIRIYDKATQIYHESILDFNNAGPHPKRKTKLYWVSCRDKSFYEKHGNKTGISIGYFEKNAANQDGKFIKSAITGFDNEKLKAELFLEIKGDGLPLVAIKKTLNNNKLNSKFNIERTLEIGPIDSDIRKPDSMIMIKIKGMSIL